MIETAGGRLANKSGRWWIFLSMVFVAYELQLVMIPVFVALFSAVLLAPVVQHRVWHRWPRSLRCLLVVGAAMALGAGMIWLLLQSVSDIATSLPAYSKKLADILSHLRQAFADWTRTSEQLLSGMSDSSPAQRVELVERFPSWPSFLLNRAGVITELFTPILFVPLLVFYILLEKENLLESADILLGRYVYLPKLHAEMPKMLRTFFLGNVVGAAVLVVGQSAVLFALGFDNWLALGILSGVLNLVPIMGAPLAVIFPIGQALVQFHSVEPFAYLFVAFLGLHFVVNNLVLPLFVGSRINLNGATLVVGILFWSWLWGALGLVLAIPMTALIKIFLESHPDTVSVANLMAGTPRFVKPTGASTGLRPFPPTQPKSAF